MILRSPGSVYEVPLEGLDATVTIKQPNAERGMRIVDAFTAAEESGGARLGTFYEILSKHLGDVVLSVHNVSVDGNPVDILAMDADEEGGIRNAEIVFPLAVRIVSAVLSQLMLSGETAKN